MTHRAILALFLLAAPTIMGCGPDRPTTVPVKGRVTFQGQAPPAAGSLMFAPREAAAGYDLRPAFGTFDEQGNVSVTTFTDNDGLVPGRYEVKVECWRVPPTETTPGESHVPPNFVAPEINVDESSKQVDLAVDVPAAK